MSKSLKRVCQALDEAGVDIEIQETDNARTAEAAATAVDCTVDQIAKSIVFLGAESGTLFLFLTAGGNSVDAEKAAALAGEHLDKAGAAVVRSQTGFAIGGVSPVGHLSPVTRFLDHRLLDFDVVWAAAGTPNHVFAIAPRQLAKITGAEPADFIA